MTKIAKTKPKAKEAKGASAKKIEMHDPKKEVRISRTECMQNARASIKMMHWSSGRPPKWLFLKTSLLWVKKGSLNHKHAIRKELVRLPGSHNLYYRYALGWRNNACII
jgi:hypothetical protein